MRIGIMRLKMRKLKRKWINSIVAVQATYKTVQV